VVVTVSNFNVLPLSHFRDFRDVNDDAVHAVKYIETVQKKVLKDFGYSELEKKGNISSSPTVKREVRKDRTKGQAAQTGCQIYLGMVS
jgi:hypothetical protein